MTSRVPPRIATWLLRHWGPGYQNESLAGDLHEEYQRNRTRRWYWRQVIEAVCIGRAAAARNIGRRLVELQRSPVRGLRQLAMSALLRLATELSVLVGAFALAAQLRWTCPSGQISEIASAFTLVGGIGLCVSIALYLPLCRFSRSQRVSRSRRTPVKSLLSVFAITALSAGTLTWASGTSRITQHCTYEGDSAVASSFKPARHSIDVD
jgi:hypothetical protein